MTLTGRLALDKMQLINCWFIHGKAWIGNKFEENFCCRVVFMGFMPYRIIRDARAEPTTPFTKAGTMVIAAGAWLSRGPWILKFSVQIDLSWCEMVAENSGDA